MNGGQERRKATKELTDWTEKWNKLKIGSDSRLDTIFNRIKKNMLEASAKHPSETIEDDPEKVKEEKKKTDKKINIPKITITEAEEEPRGGGAAEPRSSLGPIPKSEVKIRVAPKRKSSESVKFNKDLVDIEKKGRKKEILYDDENSNIYLELTILNKKDLTIEYQYSQFNKDKPRAPKGTTRKMLCLLINHLIEKNMLSNKAMVSLVAGDIEGTTEQQHDLKKLKKMYEKMGFEATAEFEKSAIYVMPIKQFFEWCQKTYTDEFFILAEKKKPKGIKSKSKVPKITITEAEEEPDVGGKAEPKSTLGPIPKSEVKIRVAPKKAEPKPTPKKPKAKKESRIQRIRRERKEALEKDKGKIIPQVQKLRPAQRKVFLDYMKLDFEDGFTLEDQLSTFEAFEELADELPTSGGAREKLNEMDIEELKVMASLYPEVYIKYIEAGKDFTGRKEKIEAQTQKDIDKANRERKKEQAKKSKK